ncbi:MAG: hypothetical protein KDI01_04655 [Halioglobus sp.]|nr:hypothetical protein [Halioglobus sp.]
MKMILASAAALGLLLAVWLLFVRPAERASQQRKLERIQRKIKALEATDNRRDENGTQARDSESR